MLDEIEVLTLFSTDVSASKAFYQKVFERPILYEDDVSFVLGFDTIAINILALSEAPELVTPSEPIEVGAAVQSVMTVRVSSVDAACERIASLGVALLNGPIDRPWGRRTAAFADPSGYVWELAEVIGEAGAAPGDVG